MVSEKDIEVARVFLGFALGCAILFDRVHPLYIWIVCSLVSLALVALCVDRLLSLGASAVDISTAISKFLLSPLMRDYKAREENYKEIIKGLQKELSKK